MAVSKRTRFEVLRRDNNTCRYCGGTAPDVTLTIDHVTPVSLGGSDDPSNLVAACKDCNAGKSSSNPDAPLVAAVSDDALRWAAALREAAERRVRDQEAQDELHDRFLDAWEAHSTHGYYAPVLPDNWWGSVQGLIAAGLPEPLLIDALRRALDATHVSYRDRFRYMCGICWRRVTEIQEEAKATLAASTEENPWEPKEDLELVGYEKGFNLGRRLGYVEDFPGRLIEDFIDKRFTGRMRDASWFPEAV